MSCEEALALMSAKLDGALSPEEEQALAAHLAACPNCSAWMQAMESVDQKVAALAEPAPTGLKKGVLYRIDQATGKARQPARRWFGPGTALGAAAAVLVLLVGLGVIPLGRRTQRQDAAPEKYAESDIMNGVPLSPETAVSLHGMPAATNGWAYYNNGGDSALTPQETNSPEPGWEAPGETSEAVKAPQASTRPRFEDHSAEAPEPDEQASGAEALRLGCVKLSEAEDAMVLLYTDFDADSLFALLREAEPDLYDRTRAMQTVEENGLLRCETDCGTALAIQEWLVLNLPASPDTDLAQFNAERRMKSRMEALDPGSSNLYRIIRFSRVGAPVAWPESWPVDWAQRLRNQESWELFYPTEDFTPQADAPALLVFPAA